MSNIDADPGKCAVCKLPWQSGRDMAAEIGVLAAKIESDVKVIAALREASTETLAALDALEVGDGNTRLSAAMAKLRTAANEQTAEK